MKTLIVNPKWNWLAGSALLLATSLISVPTATALGPQCTAPYVQVQGQGTAPAGGDPTGTLRVQSVSIGEPFDGNCNGKTITFVMKVSTLDPGNTGMVVAPYNAKWLMQFRVPDTLGTQRTLLVEWNTQTVPTGAFGYGFVDTSTGQNINRTTNCAISACPLTGTVTPDGTITIKLDISGTFTFTPATGSPILVNIPTGANLTGIQGITYICACAGGSGVISAQSTTPGNGAYTLLGNVACSAPPVAELTAIPTTGPAPLDVMFNASASNIPVDGCGTITSYIFDFGDSTGVTQSSPTTSHVYTEAGTYPASVRVVSSVGITSASSAPVNISVSSSGPPALSSVVSRLTHGGTTDFDVVLPQLPAPRAVECRSGGAGGNYKLVYTFLNNLVSVVSATVTSGAGSVATSAIGPNTNQYTVDLTGVTNAQSTTGTLLGVLDSTGATGNVSAVFGVLLGDTTGNAVVNASDVGQTKGQSGQTASASNFRLDVNVNGTVNASDIGLVKAQSGMGLP
jgi:hypothetical protein